MRILKKSLLFISLILVFSSHQLTLASNAKAFKEKVSKTTNVIKKYAYAVEAFLAGNTAAFYAAFIASNTGACYLWHNALGAFDERDSILTKFLWSFSGSVMLTMLVSL